LIGGAFFFVGLEISAVEALSPAAGCGIAAGDVVVAVDGQAVEDIIDYRFLTAGGTPVLTLERGGCRRRVRVDAHPGQDLGLDFRDPFGPLRRCANRCRFCFVEQLPPGLRPSLYVKDDDYRHSFWYGNFITLTNLTRRDFDRIVARRMSPLYISVHATDPAVRTALMGNPRAGAIMEQLNELARAGICFHAQAVLCPGINDGDVLAATVRDLGGLYPALRSLALVPVGLSRYGAPELRPFTPGEAQNLLRQVRTWQRRFRETAGEPLVFAADEFYLLAGKSVPGRAVYGDYPQLENGVGLVRVFQDTWRRARRFVPASLPAERFVVVATGRLGAPVLQPVVQRLKAVEKLRMELAVADNRLFGGFVTASGLLGGSDLVRVLEPLRGRPDLVLIPPASLRDGTVFLDDLTLAGLGERIGAPVAAPRDPLELVRLVTVGGRS